MAINLYDHQLDALKRMKNGCILCGGVGSGKSRTALAYYFEQEGGKINSKKYEPMQKPRDLYIITTARKRDQFEWDGDMAPFLLSSKPDINYYKNKIVVDSWNNIKNYRNVTNAFFIFDEQRVVGTGVWVQSFLKIAKNNDWILLSATPGDTWTDYIPVFVANGFYKNTTAFRDEHIVYARFSKFPKIDRFINTDRLIRLRNSILIDMDFQRQTIAHHEDVFVDYNIFDYKRIMKDRWNIWDNKPIKNASELCYSLRKLVNSDPSRISALLDIVEKHPRAIIFYNFDYELEILKQHCNDAGLEVAEWNGHKHQPVPTSKQWVYLVQYIAGAEGWNCITTNTIIFYSQNYSYKVMVQSSGRIDRLNTPYIDLYYYHLKSRSSIDVAISKALHGKKKFNETGYTREKQINFDMAA
jgi:hypothetical protein